MISDRIRLIAVRALAVSLLSAASAQCDGLGTALVAPDGGSVRISITPTTIAVGGDTAIISALLLDEDGSAVQNGTNVSFQTSLSGFCTPDDHIASSCDTSTRVVPIVTARTHSGVATAVLKTAEEAGTATISVRSGKIAAETSLAISGLEAPPNGTLQILASPTEVGFGAEAELTVLVLQSNGNPVADNTRVRLSPTGGSVVPGVGLTKSGLVGARFTAPAQTAVVYIRAASGALKDSVAIHVQ